MSSLTCLLLTPVCSHMPLTLHPSHMHPHTAPLTLHPSHMPLTQHPNTCTLHMPPITCTLTLTHARALHITPAQSPSHLPPTPVPHTCTPSSAHTQDSCHTRPVQCPERPCTAGGGGCGKGYASFLIWCTFSCALLLTVVLPRVTRRNGPPSDIPTQPGALRSIPGEQSLYIVL